MSLTINGSGGGITREEVESMLAWTSLGEWTKTGSFNSTSSETYILKTLLSEISIPDEYDVLRFSASWSFRATGTSSSNNLFYVRFYNGASYVNYEYRNPPTSGQNYSGESAFLFYKDTEGDGLSVSAQGNTRYMFGTSTFLRTSLNSVAFFCLSYRNCKIDSCSVTFKVEGKKL